jgi:glycerol-3-phosphate acyltransferase PlsY
MNVGIAVVAAVSGYLIGAISFARVVARIVAPGKDVTHTEMPIPGTDSTFRMNSVSATAVSIHLGPKYGCLTSLLDIVKVALPVAVFRFALPDQPYYLIAAVAGMVGHCWPIYYGFKGGGGLSAIYGGLLVISPVGVIATSLGGLLLGLLVFRNGLIVYMAGLWLIAPWLWFTTYDVGHLLYAIAVNVLFFVAMIPEIKTSRDNQRRGIETGMESGMAMTPMGRMTLKLMYRLKLLKPKSPFRADQ